MKVPCKNCDRRTVGCHAECMEYREYQKENERIKKNRSNDAINRSAIFRANYFRMSYYK